MTLGDRIRSGAKWLAVGNIGTQIIQFCVGIVLARLLAPEDFGMLATTQAFTGLAGFVSGGGMGQALVRAKKVTDKDFHVVFTLQLIICCVLYIVFYIIAPYFAQWFGDPLYQDLLRVTATYFLLRPFGNMYNSWQHREMRFKQRSIITIVVTIFGSVLSASIAWAGMGVWSLVVGGLGSTILNIILLRAITPYRPQLCFDLSSVKQHSSYGAKIAVNDIIVYLRDQTPNVIISRLAGAHVVGLYNKADSLMRMPAKLISGSTYQTVFRAMAQEQDNLDRCRYLYYRSLLLVATYTFPFYFGLWWAAEPFITFIYGPKWSPAAQPLSIMWIAGMLLAISMQSGAVAAAKNRVGSEMWIQLQILAVMIIGAYLGISFGLVGVAWGVIVAAVFEVIRLTHLALSAIEGSWTGVLRALLPALKVNAPLVIALATVDIVLPESLQTQYPGLHLAALLLTGASAYAITFLIRPPPELKSESKRWRLALVAAGRLGKPS